jgi:hypothetical protein
MMAPLNQLLEIRPNVGGGFKLQSGLDFKQFSLDHAERVLRSVWLADFACLRFSGMLCSLVPFRSPVSRMTQVLRLRASSFNEV